MTRTIGSRPTNDVEGGAIGALLHRKAIPPFAALRAFEAVGRERGIRKAALTLHLDHGVVSRHIRMLEEWLGVELFRRDRGLLHLSDVGSQYHARISGAFVEIASATADLVGDRQRNRLHLWCVPGFAAQWVTDQLTDYHEVDERNEVELRPTDVAASLLMHEADADIRFYGDHWSPKAGGKGLRFVELARPHIMAVVSPDLARQLSNLRSVEDLVKGPLLHEEHDKQWCAWFRLNGVTIKEQLPGPLLWHAHLAIAAARRGRGVALANPYLVGRDLEQGLLVELELPGIKRVVLGAYAFVAREDRWFVPAIAELRRFLQSRLKS